MVAWLLKPVAHLVKRCVTFIENQVDKWTTPWSRIAVIGALSDLTRTKAELIAENVLLRQQLVGLRRQAKRPRFNRWDRLILLWLANKARNWKNARLIVQ